MLRSVEAKNNGFVSSDARKEAGEKILPQGGQGSDRSSGGRNLSFPLKRAGTSVRQGEQKKDTRLSAYVQIEKKGVDSVLSSVRTREFT